MPTPVTPSAPATPDHAPAPAPTPDPNPAPAPVTPSAPLRSLALPVILAAVSTFLKMLVDSSKFTGWELAVANALLDFLGSFNVAGGPIGVLKQAHLASVINTPGEHLGMLRDFPREDLTPDTLKAWGEAMVKKGGRPLRENPILNAHLRPDAPVTAGDIAELIGPSPADEPARPMEPPKPPPSPAKPAYPASLSAGSGLPSSKTAPTQPTNRPGV